MATVEASEITIVEAILHLLDPDNGGFRPSTLSMPLTIPIREFLAGHVAHSLSDSQIKGARFVAYQATAAPGLLQDLVQGSNFVADPKRSRSWPTSSWPKTRAFGRPAR